MTFILLVIAFVAERAHQWQSLLSKDWTVRFQGKEVSRRLVLWTALAIGWGEGLAFFVSSEQTFWKFVFWVYVGHVLLMGVLASLRGRWRAVGVVLAAFAAAMLVAADYSAGNIRGSTWFGHAQLDLAGCVRSPLAFVLLIILATHAIPCFIANLRRAPSAERARVAAVGLGLALIEWYVVAKCVWFPDGSLFPDLTDWWNLGDGADFWLHPLWMAPFFAHVAIDAIRFFQPRTEADA